MLIFCDRDSFLHLVFVKRSRMYCRRLWHCKNKPEPQTCIHAQARWNPCVYTSLWPEHSYQNLNIPGQFHVKESEGVKRAWASKHLHCKTFLKRCLVAEFHWQKRTAIHTHPAATDEKARKGSTLALKPTADINKSPKHRYQWACKKDLCPPNLKKKRSPAWASSLWGASDGDDGPLRRLYLHGSTGSTGSTTRASTFWDTNTQSAQYFQLPVVYDANSLFSPTAQFIICSSCIYWLISCWLCQPDWTMFFILSFFDLISNDEWSPR